MQAKNQRGICVNILGIPQDIAFPEISKEKKAKKKIPIIIAQRWERLISKFKAESARKLGTELNLTDNLRDVWFQMTTHVKYVKYRILRLQGIEEVNPTQSDSSDKSGKILRGNLVKQTLSQQPQHDNRMLRSRGKSTTMVPPSRQTPRKHSHKFSLDESFGSYDLSTTRTYKFPQL